MKIVVLNQSFLTETHISKLRSLGELEVFDNTSDEETAIKRLQNADIAIVDCFIAPLGQRVLESTKNLKFISLNSTGYNGIDLVAAKNKSIVVSNVPGFATQSVAELAIGLIFAVNRKIPLGNSAMRDRPFETDPGNTDHVNSYSGFDLQGKTLGVIGLGAIGQRVAKMGNGLDMKVVGWDRKYKKVKDVTPADLKDLFKLSDVISINLALNKETNGLISKELLGLMKPSAILINTSRGGVVDELALYEVLKDKKIAGAGLDVIVKWERTNPLLQLPSVVLTPHLGWLTNDSLHNLPDIIIGNIESYIRGDPKNIVS